jgi:hypothetical protein
MTELSDHTRARYDPAFAAKKKLASFGVEEFHPGHQDQTVHGARDVTDATALADPSGQKKLQPILPAAKVSGGKEMSEKLKAGTVLYTSGTTPLYTNDLDSAKDRGTGDIVSLATTRDMMFLVHNSGGIKDAEEAAAGAEYDGVMYPHEGGSPDFSIFEYENLAYQSTIKRGSLRFESIPKDWSSLSLERKQEFVSGMFSQRKG